MKTQIQNSLQIGRTALPRRRTTVRSRLPIFIALALVVLAAVPELKAEIGFYDNLKDLAKVLPTIAGTNNIQELNSSGIRSTAHICFATFGILSHLKTQSAGGSSVQGTLFGTASLGGGFGYGTVFSLNTDGTDFTVLHNFNSSDGDFPAAGLILSSNTLYGTTVNGGIVDDGTVFALDISGTNFTVLHHFTARYHAPYTNSDGGNPYAALILSGNTLYGTASDGGSGNAGTVFALNLDNTNFTVLHSFAAVTNYDANHNLTNSDGAYPYGRLLLSDGTLYGTASGGGTGGAGTVFAINLDNTNFTALHSFAAVNYLTLTNSDGTSPHDGLILSGNMLYGTASRGGNFNLGTVFAVNTSGTYFTNLYNFTGGSDGAIPLGELLLFSNALVGTASSGGDGGNGTVFSLDTNGTDFTVLYRFTDGNYDYSLIDGGALTNSDGANPQAGLVLSGDTLYGTTSLGGTFGTGTVFSLSPLPPLTILRVMLSGTNLVINGANGQAGETNVTLMSLDLTVPLNQWTPVATNVLDATGDFTFTATNAVDAKAPRRFYILQTQ